MNLITEGQSDQWIVLSVFFGLFAISGLINRPRSKNFEYYHLFFFGALTVIANIVLIAVMNNIGMSQQSVLSALKLNELSIESSFIVLGYCIISRGLGQFVRNIFSPRSNLYSQF